MTLNKIKRVLSVCLLLCAGPSYAEGIGGKVANTTYDWARTLMENLRNDSEHTSKRIQGKEILKPEEARNDDLHPTENPDEWDFIESKKQKCWFHKRTRKKVCEGKTK